MAKRYRSRILTREEADLWALVTRGDKPLKRAGSGEASALAFSAATNELEGEAVAPAEERPPASPIEANPLPAVNGHFRKLAKGIPPLAHFETRRARQLARQRFSEAARLDLHGMRQADAHAALRGFLRDCQAEGRRHALVITGKGGSARPEEDFWVSQERGILKMLVPRWLADAEFRRFVVSFTQASSRDGGSGALYVTIRKA
jgi:DNA-nicking Smr family endonuclease